ncbi:hydroxysqualene dehydroxylase [Ensifer adhaerens]
MAGRKVAVFGGGIGGLTVAHELIERGYAVEIYDDCDVPGGKARSFGKPGSGTDGKDDLPGEHGFRFFPGFYQHVPDTMARIPTLGGTAVDNLVIARRCAIAQETKPLYVFQTHAPVTVDDWALVLQDWFGRSELGLRPGEAEYFVGRLLKYMTMCDKRRLKEMERLTWWEYIDAGNKSYQYQKLLAAGLTRSLVAMKSEVASTRTIASILVQMFMCLTELSNSMDRVLNAPTSDAWINPWVSYLTGLGVQFNQRHRFVRFDIDGQLVSSARVQSPTGELQITADYYVAAFPVEVAQTLLVPTLGPISQSIAKLVNLKYDWMNGLQFYLARDVEICRGHVICADSRWAVTLISQPQFWTGINMGAYGDGTTPGLLSIDISSWDTPGNKTTLKPAKNCTEHEIVAEVWAQLKDHLDATTYPLTNSDRVNHFLDPAIVIGNPTVNREPLLINTCGSWESRPRAATELPNLFLASDYVQTNTDLACMEGANEAGRRAANAILLADNSAASHARIFSFDEPIVFAPLREIDEVLFNLGLPNPGRTVAGWLSTARGWL